MLDPALEMLLRGALALLLGTGAIAKSRDLPTLRAAIEGYELLPARAIGAAAIGFTGVEALLAVGLVAPAALGVRATALAAAAALFTAYGIAIAINLARGRREIDCGCGGAAAHVPLSGWLVARNAALIAMAVACLSGAGARSLGWIDALSIAGGIGVLALVWTALHGLLAYEAALGRMQEDL